MSNSCGYCIKSAIRSAQFIGQRLYDFWYGLRLQKMDVPALALIIDDNSVLPHNLMFTIVPMHRNR